MVCSNPLYLCSLHLRATKKVKRMRSAISTAAPTMLSTVSREPPALETTADQAEPWGKPLLKDFILTETVSTVSGMGMV